MKRTNIIRVLSLLLCMATLLSLSLIPAAASDEGISSETTEEYTATWSYNEATGELTAYFPDTETTLKNHKAVGTIGIGATHNLLAFDNGKVLAISHRAHAIDSAIGSTTLDYIVVLDDRGVCSYSSEEHRYCQKSCFSHRLNIVNIEVVIETLARHELRVIHLGIELLHRNTHIGIVWRCKEVEIEGIMDGCLEQRNQVLSRDGLLAKVGSTHQSLTLTLNEEHLLAVDEDATNEVALIGRAVELERVGEEVVDVDDTTVGVGLICLDILILPYRVIRIEVEYIGVHTHDEKVGGDLELRLELTSIAILDADTTV